MNFVNTSVKDGDESFLFEELIGICKHLGS